MPRGLIVHRFGPFELDLAGGRLFRGGNQIPLFQAHAAVLVHLVEHAGSVVSKDALMQAGWARTAVTDNNLDQAISRLRRKFAEVGDDAEYIATVPHRGYRFVGIVTTGYRTVPETALDEQLAPYHALVQGRIDVNSLDRERLLGARRDLEMVVQQSPECTAADVELAMACALLVESSAMDPHADPATLKAGIERARAACARPSAAADAWVSLALLLAQNGEREAAIAAAIKATELDPEDLRLLLCVAYISSGEARLRWARRALKLCPDLVLAHWLRTSVFIGRGVHDMAIVEARLGCAAQDAQTPQTSFPGVGMHLHHGHLLAAQDRLEDAIEEFEREHASCAVSTNIYARESTINTWYAIGAVRRRQNRHDAAEAAFRRALEMAPGHVSAAAVLHGTIPVSAAPLDVALAQAIVFARAGRHADAARVHLTALQQEPPGSAGWILSVEPTLNTSAHPEEWAEALALVRARAM